MRTVSDRQRFGDEHKASIISNLVRLAAVQHSEIRTTAHRNISGTALVSLRNRTTMRKLRVCRFPPSRHTRMRVSPKRGAVSDNRSPSPSVPTQRMNRSAEGPQLFGPPCRRDAVARIRDRL